MEERAIRKRESNNGHLPKNLKYEQLLSTQASIPLLHSRQERGRGEGGEARGQGGEGQGKEGWNIDVLAILFNSGLFEWSFNNPDLIYFSPKVK